MLRVAIVAAQRVRLRSRSDSKARRHLPFVLVPCLLMAIETQKTHQLLESLGERLTALRGHL